jgi:hypothetical protein
MRTPSGYTRLDLNVTFEPIALCLTEIRVLLVRPGTGRFSFWYFFDVSKKIKKVLCWSRTFLKIENTKVTLCHSDIFYERSPFHKKGGGGGGGGGTPRIYIKGWLKGGGAFFSPIYIGTWSPFCVQGSPSVFFTFLQKSVFLWCTFLKNDFYKILYFSKIKFIKNHFLKKCIIKKRFSKKEKNSFY